MSSFSLRSSSSRLWLSFLRFLPCVSFFQFTSFVRLFHSSFYSSCTFLPLFPRFPPLCPPQTFLTFPPKKKLATDLNHCLLELTCRTRSLTLHFSLTRYIPSNLFTRKPSPPSTIPFAKRIGGAVRRSLSKITMLVLRKESIYAFKCATAVLIYMMVLMNQTAWYLQWYLQASFLTFLVAVGPSVGQTNLTFVINLAGAIIGYTMAYLVLTAFGTGRNALNKVCYGWVGCDWGGSGTQYALWGASLVFAVPMIYVQLYTRLSVLGLLSLLSYSTSLIGSWANRNNPRFDNPWHRYYKLLASASMAITFALIFTLLVYPNLARHRLRLSISSILRRLNALYTHILSTAYAPTETSTPPISTSPSFLTTPMEDISTLLLELYRDLFSLEENMLFAAVEFRITGPFRWNTYKAILARLRGIHERLASAVSIIGDQGPFDPYLRKLLETSLRKSRRDLQTIIRLLLYIYSSSMVAKQPLPPDLPSASKARIISLTRFGCTLRML
ncbi:hypothetical protein BC829DRAFT_175772 [Chytridium lagenaria]|nr:hypothetical protein BC829DRAFT_175772 [Chytridium lagenaria]